MPDRGNHVLFPLRSHLIEWAIKTILLFAMMAGFLSIARGQDKPKIDYLSVETYHCFTDAMQIGDNFLYYQSVARIEYKNGKKDELLIAAKPFYNYESMKKVRRLVVLACVDWMDEFGDRIIEARKEKEDGKKTTTDEVPRVPSGVHAKGYGICGMLQKSTHWGVRLLPQQVQERRLLGEVPLETERQP